MALSSKIRAARITGTGAVTALAPRARIRAFNVVTSGTAGRFTVTDGSGGGTLIDHDTPISTAQYVLLPGDGILAETGVYVSALTNITSVTIYAE